MCLCVYSEGICMRNLVRILHIMYYYMVVRGVRYGTGLVVMEGLGRGLDWLQLAMSEADWSGILKKQTSSLQPLE